MRKINKYQSNNLRSRILQLQSECEALIDSEAERQAQPGVPHGSIKTLLTARWPGNIFLAALDLLQNQKEGN